MLRIEVGICVEVEMVHMETGMARMWEWNGPFGRLGWPVWRLEWSVREAGTVRIEVGIVRRVVGMVELE